MLSTLNNIMNKKILINRPTFQPDCKCLTILFGFTSSIPYPFTYTMELMGLRIVKEIDKYALICALIWGIRRSVIFKEK